MKCIHVSDDIHFDDKYAIYMHRYLMSNLHMMVYLATVLNIPYSYSSK